MTDKSDINFIAIDFETATPNVLQYVRWESVLYDTEK